MRHYDYDDEAGNIDNEAHKEELENRASERSDSNEGLCADCREVMGRPFINGDDVERCEACAVEKYKQGQVSMLWPKDKPYRPI